VVSAPHQFVVLGVTVYTTRSTTTRACDIEFRVAVVHETPRQNTDGLYSSGPDKYFMRLLGHSMCLFILPYSAGILGVTRAGWYASSTTILVLQISQEGHVRIVVGKGLVVGGNHRKRREAGARRTNSNQRSALRARRRNKGYAEVKSSSIEVPRSEPLDQEVKTKLILEPVNGSKAHRWANTIEIK